MIPTVRLTEPRQATLIAIYNSGHAGLPRDAPDVVWLDSLDRLCDVGLIEFFDDDERILTHRVRTTREGDLVTRTLLLKEIP